MTQEGVEASRKQHGLNLQHQKTKSSWWILLLEILKEPMLLLLITISIIYFILGSLGEAYFMLAAIILVSGISFYQDNRSRKALEALEQLNTPLSKVIRSGSTQSILTTEIVPGDLVIAEEGSTINADGYIVYSHDFSVNESTLTGESATVNKSVDTDDNKVYSGTLTSSGLAVYTVEKTGPATKIGKLG